MRGRPWGDGEHATAAAFFEARKNFVMKTGALDRLGEFWDAKDAKDAKEANEAKGVREAALKDALKDTETEEAEETETATTAAAAAVQVDAGGAASAVAADSAIPLSSPPPPPPPPSPTIADQDVCADLELGGAPAEFDSMGNFYCLRLHHLLFQRDQMRYLL